MLPPFIIDQIREREERERARHEQPVIHLPLPIRRRTQDQATPEEKSERGVVIIDLMG